MSANCFSFSGTPYGAIAFGPANPTGHGPRPWTPLHWGLVSLDRPGAIAPQMKLPNTVTVDKVVTMDRIGW